MKRSIIHIIIFGIVLLSIMLTSCQYERLPRMDPQVMTSTIMGSDCVIGVASMETPQAYMRLTAQARDFLLIEAYNIEYNCGAVDISVSDSSSNNSIYLTIIPSGESANCICQHNLQFWYGPLEEEQEYTLHLIEPFSAYHHDTLSVTFTYTPYVDTTIIADSIPNDVSTDPFSFDHTELGGCNNGVAKASSFSAASDSLAIFEWGDSLQIFVGFGANCCFTFGTKTKMSADTLKMYVYTIQEDYCDCSCYFTFDFWFNEYTGQGFFYKVYLYDEIWKQGEYNSP